MKGHRRIMKHIMFDIDGTLVQSYEFDEACFLAAVKTVTGIDLINDWDNYPHITDRGILQTFIERQAPHEVLESLEKRVKAVFIGNVKEHLKQYPAKEVSGAKAFVKRLSDDETFAVSFATGGWGETAILKLESAGFDTDLLNIKSSNDHHSRTEIMTLAMLQVADKHFDSQNHNFTYFGDAQWDIQACDQLGVNLVIVGNRVSHYQTIEDFSDMSKSLEFALV